MANNFFPPAPVFFFFFFASIISARNPVKSWFLFFRKIHPERERERERLARRHERSARGKSPIPVKIFLPPVSLSVRGIFRGLGPGGHRSLDPRGGRRRSRYQRLNFTDGPLFPVGISSFSKSGATVYPVYPPPLLFSTWNSTVSLRFSQDDRREDYFIAINSLESEFSRPGILFSLFEFRVSSGIK